MTKKRHTPPQATQPPLICEASWEICNQVGGIYTVIRSKIPATLEQWDKSNYLALGPYFEEKAISEFDETESNGLVGQVVQQMKKNGYDVRMGRWLVSGRPMVVLFNPYSVFDRLGEIKYMFWEHHGVSLPDEQLLNEVIAYGYLVQEFFIALNGLNKTQRQVVAHFHEWMGGIPVPGIRRNKLAVKTVFTTHATLLGRYLAMNDDNFYDNLPFYDWAKEAEKFNIKHLVEIERAAAHGAHVFSTVSKVTGRECEYLLGRSPDVVMPNGLNIERFEVLHEIQTIHKSNKERIQDFVMGHFFQSYSFDLDNTLFFFTSGRFEYHNKGYNLTLEALARLNWMMKEEKIDKTVVAFFITRRPFHNFNSEVLQNKAQIEEIRNVTKEIRHQLSTRFYNKVTSDQVYAFPEMNDMVDDYYKLKLRRVVQRWKSKQLPSIVTHNLVDDGGDEILNFMRTANLINKPEDPVKVVYHPDFIEASNPLFKMDYKQFVRGCHMGIFPSYYEPWGYTPLECLASGVPSVTSDLSGFGDYVSTNIPDHRKHGMFIVRRRNRSYDQAADELANSLMDFVRLERRDRIELRNSCESASLKFDWQNLRKFYDNAYEEAMRMKL